MPTRRPPIRVGREPATKVSRGWFAGSKPKPRTITETIDAHGFDKLKRNATEMLSDKRISPLLSPLARELYTLLINSATVSRFKASFDLLPKRKQEQILEFLNARSTTSR